ncbi:MAG: GDSL-type esterase/lipase family protein [Gemmatimonadales bacterium]
MSALWWRTRISRLLGLTLILAAFLRYESWSNRTVLGRWSPVFAACVALFAVLWVLALVVAWRRWRGGASRVPAARHQVLADLGLLVWSAAFFRSSLDSRANAGLPLDFVVTGSVVPMAALLEWLGVLLVAAAVVAWASSRLDRGWAKAIVLASPVIGLFLAGEGLVRVWTVVAGPYHTGFAAQLWERRYAPRNRLGFRDVDHAVTPPSGTHRLLLVGDSFGYGAGVRRLGDRFGEKLATRLQERSGEPWEAVSASLPDRHTLQEIEELKRMLRFQPSLVVLLYVFNDIDYLATATSRTADTEAAGSILSRLHPLRVASRNSYLFQEAVLRVRMLGRRAAPAARAYADSTVMRRHMQDLDRFAQIASDGGAAVAIVPFDLHASTNPNVRTRYERWVSHAQQAGLPVVSIADAFIGRPVETLMVNTLDRHPNALGHRLGAEAATDGVLAIWRTQRATRIEGPRQVSEVAPPLGPLR